MDDARGNRPPQQSDTRDHRPATEAEAGYGLNDTYPGDPVPVDQPRTIKRYEPDDDGYMEEHELGEYVRLEDIKDALDPLINSARILDLYGATISRLTGLKRALEHLDKRME